MEGLLRVSNALGATRVCGVDIWETHIQFTNHDHGRLQGSIRPCICRFNPYAHSECFPVFYVLTWGECY